jgi:LacI family transcriptional regulator
MAGRPTIIDVAREANVSPASVSAVLNDKEGIGNATRARILEVCQRLNYRPNTLARLRSHDTVQRSIGLVIKELENPYFFEVAAGALSAGRARGYTMLLASSEGDTQREREAVELMVAKSIDGLILTPVLNGDADLSHLVDLRRRNFPFVLLEEIRGIPASVIDIQNVEASRAAVEHLLAEGHRHIIHFAGPEHFTHARERIEGFHHAFSHSNWPIPSEPVVQTGARLEDGYRTGLEYFGERLGGELPTGVTCYNDMVAAGLVRALRELGLRVPEDVSVVGFDDIQLLDYLSLSLTSVRIPKRDIGRRAAELLIRQIESQEALPPIKEFFQGQLILRGTTRARPAVESAA